MNSKLFGAVQLPEGVLYGTPVWDVFVGVSAAFWMHFWDLCVLNARWLDG